MLAQVFFHFVTIDAFDRRREMPLQYRALRHRQSHGNNRSYRLQQLIPQRTNSFEC